MLAAGWKAGSVQISVGLTGEIVIVGGYGNTQGYGLTADKWQHWKTLEAVARSEAVSRMREQAA